MQTPSNNRTSLPLFVVFLCVLVIIYASLQPFTGWLWSQPISLAAFAAPAKFIPAADVAFNAIAYLPLGFALYAMTSPSRSLSYRLVQVIAITIALSIAVEMLQSLLPTRVSSIYDTLANLAGAIAGAAFAAYVLSWQRLVALLNGFRERLFVSGTSGDFQIILLIVWLLAQVNPGIPLFGATFHPGMNAAFEPAVVAVEIGQTAAFFVGIGLFTDLVMRKRFLGGVALVVVISVAVAMKTLAAHWFLTPIAWENWLRPGNALGIAIGATTLTVLFWLPREVKSIIAGISLISGALIPLLLPDLVLQRAPLSQFAWSYGQLLNINGLSRSVILVWPFVATLLLLTRFSSVPSDERKQSIKKVVG